MNLNYRDLALRAFHTFWQSFVAVLGVTWAASGIDVSQLTDIASAKKVIVAALAAVVASALSAAKTTVKAMLAGKSGILETDDPDPADIPAPAPVTPAVTPADPGQPAAGVPPGAEVVTAEADPHLVQRLAGGPAPLPPVVSAPAAPPAPPAPPAAG